MNVTIALDARYSIKADGSVWSRFGMARSFWERYLEVFDRVTIVARAEPLAGSHEGCLPVNSKEIYFQRIPNYCGPLEFIRRYSSIRSAIHAAVPLEGAVILRVASQVANLLEAYLRRRRHPYGLEVVGDPYEVFAPGVVDHALRRLFRCYFVRKMQRQCRQAAAVAYVTKWKLQQRYPASAELTSVSDVDLPGSAFVDGCRAVTNYSSIEMGRKWFEQCGRRRATDGPFRIVSVGSLAQLYKGTDVLIHALAKCVQAGMEVMAVIVGDGEYKPFLMALAERIGMASRISFLGQIPAGEGVRRILDSCDLFVLPSRTEGLPRALIEAMARGLPCIGSDVGGIPELLDSCDLVPVGDPSALALKIRGVLTDPLRMAEMSARNVAEALNYRDEVLRERRLEFYRYLRTCTEDWESRERAN